MTTEYIFKNNKLIAEFMGGKYNVDLQFTIAQEEIWLPIYGICNFRRKGLKYHSSWDWLIPVIENIDHLQHEPVMSIENALSTRSIDNTYKAVIEFIKEYNNN